MKTLVPPKMSFTLYIWREFAGNFVAGTGLKDWIPAEPFSTIKTNLRIHHINYSPVKMNKKTAKVSFNNVEIIELPYTVGDGPSSGAFLTVGWEPVDRSVFNINLFETYRTRSRRSKSDLRLSKASRRLLLLNNGHSLKEISCGEEAAMRLRKERFLAFRMRRRLRQMAYSSASVWYFSPLPQKNLRPLLQL